MAAREQSAVWGGGLVVEVEAAVDVDSVQGLEAMSMRCLAIGLYLAVEETQRGGNRDKDNGEPI